MYLLPPWLRFQPEMSYPRTVSHYAPGVSHRVGRGLIRPGVAVVSTLLFAQLAVAGTFDALVKPTPLAAQADWSAISQNLAVSCS